MLLAAGQTVVILGISGEPADLFAGRFSTDIAAGGSDLAVTHGFRLGTEGFGDKFLICLITDLDLFLPVLGNTEIVYGEILQSLLLIQRLQDPGRVAGISQCFMEGLILGKLQRIDDGLEIFPGTSVFSLKTVDLLNIQVAEREGKWIFHMIET